MKSFISSIIFVLFHFGSYAQPDSIYTDFHEAHKKKAFSKVIHLDLSDHDYFMAEYGGKLPNTLKDFVYLETLKLSPHSYLIELPKWISKLKNLKSLAFNDRYLNCANKALLNKLNIKNPLASGASCYETVKGIAQNMVGVEKEGKLSVLNIATATDADNYMLFPEVDQFYITPCNQALIVTEDTIFSTPSSWHPQDIRRQDFIKIALPSPVKKVKLGYCEGGIHTLFLENKEQYYYHNWHNIFVKKSNKKLPYDTKTKCQKVIDELEDKFAIQFLLSEYYFYCKCDEKALQKAREQVDKVKAQEDYYYTWDSLLQDIVPQK